MTDRCFYCGIPTNGDTRSVDHVTPLCRNGGNMKTNKVNACKDCNGLKAHHTLDEFRRVYGVDLFWAERVGDPSLLGLRPCEPNERFVLSWRTRKPKIVRRKSISRMGVEIPVKRYTPTSEIGS